MNIQSTTTGIAQQKADAIVLGIFEDGEPGGHANRLDEALGGVLDRLRNAGTITGKKFELVPLHGLAPIEADLVLVAGLGRRDQFDRGMAFRAAAAAARNLSSLQRDTVAFFLGDEPAADVVTAGVAGAVVGCEGQDLYRKEKKQYPFHTIRFADAPAESLRQGQILGEAVNLARRLINEPASNIYPESFAEAARQATEEHGVQLEIWDEGRLKEERCGALLAVGQGSERPPRLVIARYRGGGEDAPTLALVGKGVTFDSGGLSIKPSDGMKTMKMDMAGAATVLGAIQGIARLKLPANVTGIMGLVENLPSGRSYKLGDVLTTRNGKTIEVLNTDAEGRLVLADALDVAVSEGAERIIDLATLTGACVVALGHDVAGLMSNNQLWCNTVAAAAKACGEPAWELPMFEDYDEDIKTDIADMKNIGDGRWAGAITAAKLLEQFVGDTPWTHIDIAGPAFVEKSKPWIEGGGSGCFVRTLIEVAEGFGKE